MATIWTRAIPLALCAAGCSAGGGTSHPQGEDANAGSAGRAAGPEPTAPLPEATGGAGALPSMGGHGGVAGSFMGGGGVSEGGGPETGGTSAKAPYPYDLGVRFEWEETDAPDGPCLPGVYEGTFTCELAFIPGLPGFPFTGPVRFTLERSDTGEFLEITDGLLEGDAGGILFSSTLGGQLDCATDAFSANAVDGTYAGPGIVPGTFTGTLEATLERSSQLLTGTWSLTAQGQPPCVGPWSARRVP